MSATWISWGCRTYPWYWQGQDSAWRPQKSPGERDYMCRPTVTTWRGNACRRQPFLRLRGELARVSHASSPQACGLFVPTIYAEAATAQSGLSGTDSSNAAG